MQLFQVNWHQQVRGREGRRERVREKNLEKNLRVFRSSFSKKYRTLMTLDKARPFQYNKKFKTHNKRRHPNRVTSFLEAWFLFVHSSKDFSIRGEGLQVKIRIYLSSVCWSITFCILKKIKKNMSWVSQIRILS